MRVDARYKIAGYVGWLAIAAPTLLDVQAGSLRGPRALAWVAAFLIFGVVYGLYLRPSHVTRRRPSTMLALAALAIAGLGMVLTSVGLMKYLASITLTIVAGELPYVFAPRVVWTWIAAQSIALATVFGLSFGWVAGLAGGSAYAGFQIFALGRAWMELRERAAREELARANADLRATRALLAESSREAERLRIARDLHDTLGHHLTALSLQLDVAARKLEGSAADHVREAHAISRLLLADVRDVVGRLRENGHPELSAALGMLAAPHGHPRVHVDVPDGFTVEHAAHANALLRCAQEVITNAVRHAHADNVWIQVTTRPEGTALDARDDGTGAAAVRPGHGLMGMRERFEEQGGRVEFVTKAGEGFRVHAFIPRPERGA